VLGAGFIGDIHARAYHATPGVRVVGIADPVAAKAERVADECDAKVVPDLEQLLDLEVDVVSVCTPPSSHADLAIRALDAGKHVLCEKPLARTLEDGRRLVEAAEQAAGLLMVGHVSRFEPDHRLAKELVDGGQVGPVQMISHSITTSMPGWSEGGWLFDPEKSGGPLLDLSVHGFDYLSWLVGSEPIRVHAVGADTPVGPATYTLSTVRFANGALGLVESSWAHPATRGFRLAAEMAGPGGRIRWSYDDLVGGVLHPIEGEPVWFDSLGERGFQAEIRAFADAIRSGGPSPVPARDGYRALRVALAALESLQTGTTIDLTTWEAL
jgi:myo-inositol 2-dehydrogenase/D-chiro-inositol 1-dehydrogenase